MTSQGRIVWNAHRRFCDGYDSDGVSARRVRKVAGMFDLTAMDEWMTARHSNTATCALTVEAKPRNAAEVFDERRARHGGQG
jgi:hypothetical protein